MNERRARLAANERRVRRASNIAITAVWLFVLAVFVGGVWIAEGGAQEKPNPCSAFVFKETQDSLYAELQAPRGTKRCVVEIE